MRSACIRFGVQAMFGLLNNELINEPGQAKLDQLDLADRLCNLIGLLERRSPLPNAALPA
jgi:hypothetical protein